jgi:hypothetical protein
MALRPALVILGAIAFGLLLHMPSTTSVDDKLELSGTYRDRTWLPFSSARWRELEDARSMAIYDRYLMIPDLLAKHPLVGSRGEDVTGLLGGVWYAGRNTALYYVGVDSQPLLPGPLYLQVWFSDGIATEIELTGKPRNR